jgi:hypothetical protein
VASVSTKVAFEPDFLPLYIWESDNKNGIHFFQNVPQTLHKDTWPARIQSVGHFDRRSWMQQAVSKNLVSHHGSLAAGLARRRFKLVDNSNCQSKFRMQIGIMSAWNGPSYHLLMPTPIHWLVVI